MDHLGNTRIVFHTTYDCKELDYVAEYVADYYPFGKVLREWVNCEVERYLRIPDKLTPLFRSN